MLLNKFKENCESKTELNYFYAFKRFFDSVDDFTGEEPELYLKNLKDRKQVSNLKKSFEFLLENKLIRDDEVNNNVLEQIKKEQERKPKHKKRPEPQFKLRNAECSINHLKNKRLKLGYRLQIISGLRVAELADLEPEDISIKDNKQICIRVKSGKGGNERHIVCFEDEWVLDNILEIEPRKNNKLFYSESYLKNSANRLGFHTHDLRKVFSNIFYYNCADDKYTTVRNLQRQLGHKIDSKTYLKYINRDINLYHTKWSKMKPF
jgi:integrase